MQDQKPGSPQPREDYTIPGAGTRLKSPLRSVLWSMAGTFFLAVGLIGVAIPILPTTPFLLLAAACYLRGSRRMYCWMMTNKLFGRYLKDYHEGRGISWRVKLGTIAFLWTMISISALFFTDNILLRVSLLLIALAVSSHIALIRPKRFEKEPQPSGKGPPETKKSH